MKIFQYVADLDCFVVSKGYLTIANQLGLNEWNEVVWMGRYFAMDNDNGEHWFDNWTERDKIEKEAENLRIDYDDLLVIDPDRFKNGIDGPCHSDQERKMFWTDVLKSLDISLEVIFNEARKLNSEREETDDDFVVGIEEIIKEISQDSL